MSKRSHRREQPAAPARPKLRIGETEPAPRAEPLPWHATVEGVLGRALAEHGKQPYEELLIIGLRGGSVPEIYKFSGDTLRLVGIMEWAKGVLLTRKP